MGRALRTSGETCHDDTKPQTKVAVSRLCIRAVMASLLLVAGVPLFGQSLPSNRFVFATFAAGSTASAAARSASQTFQTIFWLTNPYDQPARVEVFFSDRFGKAQDVSVQSDSVALPPGMVSFTLPSRGNFVLRTIERGRLKSGWVEIRASEPIVAREEIAVVDLLRIGAPCPPFCDPFVIRSVADIQAFEPSPKAVIEVAPKTVLGLTRLTDTAIAIAYPYNPRGRADQRPAIGLLTLFDSQGKRLATKAVTLQPGEQLVGVVSEVFQLPPLMSPIDPLALGGQVEVDFSNFLATDPVFIAGVGLNLNSGLLFSTAAGPTGTTQRRFGASLSIDQSVYFVNLMPVVGPAPDPAPTMKMRFEVFNFTDIPLNLNFSSGCTVGVEIKNSQGETVIRLPGFCPAVAIGRRLVNDSFVSELDIKLAASDGRFLPEGTYTIEAHSLAVDRKLSASGSFEIKHVF